MSKFCEQCGKPVNPEAKFCEYCGVVTETAATGTGPVTSTLTKPQRRKDWSAGEVITIVVALTLLWAAFQGGSEGHSHSIYAEVASVPKSSTTSPSVKGTKYRFVFRRDSWQRPTYRRKMKRYDEWKSTQHSDSLRRASLVISFQRKRTLIQ